MARRHDRHDRHGIESWHPPRQTGRLAAHDLPAPAVDDAPLPACLPRQPAGLSSDRAQPSGQRLPPAARAGIAPDAVRTMSPVPAAYRRAARREAIGYPGRTVSRARLTMPAIRPSAAASAGRPPDRVRATRRLPARTRLAPWRQVDCLAHRLEARRTRTRRRGGRADRRCRRRTDLSADVVPVDHVEPVHRPIKLTDPVEQIATRTLGPLFQSR